MNFFVWELNEWVQIEKVSSNSSVGYIRRSFDENKQEKCFDNTMDWGNVVPCKIIKIGMKAETKNTGF